MIPVATPHAGEASQRPTLGLHVGSETLLPDVSLDFQLQRWTAYGGPCWLADVRPVLSRLTSLDAWRDMFVELGERAMSEGRGGHAALHFRSAEFFMTPADPRKAPLRARLLPMLREAAGLDVKAQREIPFEGLRLPAWHLTCAQPRGTIVVFGGFDSYLEELFPIHAWLRDERWNVIAFEGPGQGSVLHDQGAPMIREWHRPVAAVLDAFALDDITLVGVSLGGCLAIRAAAFEPRIRRVVAFDVLTDFLGCMSAQQPPVIAALVRAALTLGARRPLDRALGKIGRKSPVAEWGLAQAQHVFGCHSPADALSRARDYHTRDVSPLVRQDVLLLAGANDHYVPLPQLWEQARLLSTARSITARVFTSGEHAGAHCQVGNLPLALSVISEWASLAAGAGRAP